MSHLEELQRLINDVYIDDSLQPEDKISPEEVLLGEMSDEIKRIYILRSQADQQVRDIIADSISSGKDPAENPERLKILKRAKELRDLLAALLWFAVYEEFDLWADESVDGVALRENWKVVSYKNPSRDILDQLSRFL